MQLGLLGLIAEQGEFEGLDGSGDVAAFEYLSLGRDSKADSFGYCQSPVDPKGARGKIATNEFTEKEAAHFIDAVEKWLPGHEPFTAKLQDRKSVVKGKRGSVRVNLGGGRICKKKKKKTN